MASPRLGTSPTLLQKVIPLYHKISSYLFKPLTSYMSTTNMTLEERFDALMKQNEFLSRKIQEEARKDQETQA